MVPYNHDCSIKCLLQLSSSNRITASSISNVTTLKRIINRSFDILTSKTKSDSMDMNSSESDAIAESLIDHFSSELMCEESDHLEGFEGHVNVDMDLTNWKKLNELIRVYFPGFSCTTDGEKRSSVKTELAEAIKTQLKEHHLQNLHSFEQKVYM